MMAAMSENMTNNLIDIQPEGNIDASHADGDPNIQITPEGDVDPEGNAGDVAVQDGEVNTPTDQDVSESIRENANNPATAQRVQSALIDGMIALIDIEKRVRTNSGNINHKGINIETLHDTYMNFTTERGTLADPAKLAKLGEAAQAMAGDIGKVLAKGQLSAGEISQLKSILSGLTGDANLAEAYVGRMVAAPAGSTPPGGNPGNGGLLADGFVPAGDGNVPLDDGTNVPSMDEGGESGYNKDENPSVDWGIVEIKAPPEATPEQIRQVQAYVEGCNEALGKGRLSSTGRVSTTGELRRQASRAAQTERQRAARAGKPYKGHAGHVPDTTWTGTAEPYLWLDLDPVVNLSLGGQAGGYPIGFRPTGFVYKGDIE